MRRGARCKNYETRPAQPAQENTSSKLTKDTIAASAEHTLEKDIQFEDTQLVSAKEVIALQGCQVSFTYT